jgi:hypothetical protein
VRTGSHNVVVEQANNFSRFRGFVVGRFNVISNKRSSVSGGSNITQEAENGWAAGSEADEVVVSNFRSP